MVRDYFGNIIEFNQIKRLDVIKIYEFSFKFLTDCAVFKLIFIFITPRNPHERLLVTISQISQSC